MTAYPVSIAASYYPGVNIIYPKDDWKYKAQVNGRIGPDTKF